MNCRSRQPDPKPNVSSCKPCPLSASDPVCGSDGHNYASQVHTHTNTYFKLIDIYTHTKWYIGTADFPILLNQELNQIFIRVNRVKSVREEWRERGKGLRGKEKERERKERAASEGERKRRCKG